MTPQPLGTEKLQMFIGWFPQVSENIQLGTGRPMAGEGPISRRGSGMRLVAWDQWEQSKGEHDVKQKEGSARNRKKAVTWGPESRRSVGCALGLS